MKALPILVFSVFAVLNSVAQIKNNLQHYQTLSEVENSQTKSENYKSEITTRVLNETQHFQFPEWILMESLLKEMRFADPNKTYKTSHNLKSAVTEMQRLDSFVVQSYNQNSGTWINSYKYVAEYDSTGIQKTFLTLRWNGITSIWENWSKIDFKYIPYGKLLSEIRFGWDKINNTWINKSKYEYAYDPEGNMILNAY